MNLFLDILGQLRKSYYSNKLLKTESFPKILERETSLVILMYCEVPVRNDLSLHSSGRYYGMIGKEKARAVCFESLHDDSGST